MPLIAGNDMAQTATNVTGDLFAATVVAKTEGELGYLPKEIEEV